MMTAPHLTLANADLLASDSQGVPVALLRPGTSVSLAPVWEAPER